MSTLSLTSTYHWQEMDFPRLGYGGSQPPGTHRAVDRDLQCGSKLVAITEAIANPGKLLFQLFDHLADIICFQYDLGNTPGEGFQLCRYEDDGHAVT